MNIHDIVYVYPIIKRGFPLNLQVSAVQVYPTEVLAEFHSSGALQPVKTNLHIKGIYTTNVSNIADFMRTCIL